MPPLYILSIVALVVTTIIAIVVWTIVLLEYKKILRQRKIDKIIDKIRERAEDSGNESDGDHEELSALVERGHLALDMGHDAPWNVDDL
uniref:Protein Vpu n=1 Tax=Human immunodeficiency virus type 1 TaxID=11676 RepID=A0A650DHA6_HV1|nr:vpu protein [Human immunodeficiency virus 1]